MNDSIPYGSVEAHKLCGAKTRAGMPCKRLPARPKRGGRCNLHGGKSRSGMSHPNFKHGLYSKAWLFAGTARRDYEEGVKKRRQQREDNYVLPKLAAWHESRRVWNVRTCDAFMAMSRKLRREYHDGLAARRAKYRARVERDRG